jgi:hypothetical protein
MRLRIIFREMEACRVGRISCTHPTIPAGRNEMKYLGVSCMLIGMALAGCRRPEAGSQALDAHFGANDQPGEFAPASEPASASFSPSVFEPRAASAPVSATASGSRTRPVAAPEYAPAGVFYLVVSVHKETKDGISRLPAGTEVKLLRPGFYRTPIGDVAVDARLLTRDMAEARMVRAVDAARQAAAYASVPMPTPFIPPAPQRLNPVATASMQPTTNAVEDANIRALRFKIDSLQQEIANLRSRGAYLIGRTQRIPLGISTSTASSDYMEINRQIEKAQVEIGRLEMQLRNAQGPAGEATANFQN